MSCWAFEAVTVLIRVLPIPIQLTVVIAAPGELSSSHHGHESLSGLIVHCVLLGLEQGGVTDGGLHLLVAHLLVFDFRDPNTVL